MTMTPVEQLHTAVRRYCFDRVSMWYKAYGELPSAGKDRDGAKYTDEALGIFPRYNVLNAIVEEVERFRPYELGDISEAKEFLNLAILTAQSVFTQKPIGTIDGDAINDERERLASFIQTRDAESLVTVLPLFYRRVLSGLEISAVRQRLEDKWQVDKGYWYPLSAKKQTMLKRSRTNISKEK
jgi:hypothetical protein